MPQAPSSRADRLVDYLAADPDNEALLLDALEALVVERRAGEAQALLPRTSGHLPRVRHAEGQLALQARDWPRAQAIYSDLLHEHKDDLAARFALAWSLAQLQRLDAALDYLDATTVEKLPQAAALRVRILHQFGRLDEAEALARASRARHPEHGDLAAAVSVLALDIGDERLGEEAAAAASDHPEALTTAGTLALGRERATEALDHFTRATDANPALPRAWIGRGLAELLTGSPAAAAADIDKGASMFGDHLGSWIAAGWAHFAAGDVATARQRFEEAERLDATFPEAHGSIAVLDLLDGNRAAAQNRSEVALRLDRECFSAALARSLLAADRGETSTAKRIFDLAARTPVDASGRTIAHALATMGLG